MLFLLGLYSDSDKTVYSDSDEFLRILGDYFSQDFALKTTNKIITNAAYSFLSEIFLDVVNVFLVWSDEVDSVQVGKRLSGFSKIL